MPLTAIQVKQAKPRDRDYKLYDGRGLFVLIATNGSKYWRLKYRVEGKEKTLALGVYPDVSLADAREKCQQARSQMKNGIDPGVAKRVEKLTRDLSAADTFEAIAREWFEVKMRDRSKSHRDRTLRALESDLFPTIGSRPIGEVSAPELLATLRKIEKRGAIETAKRANQTAGQIFRYAVATGRGQQDPSAALKGALQNPKKRHHAALTEPGAVGQLMLAIHGYRGTATVRGALKISPYLFQCVFRTNVTAHSVLS